MADPSPQTWLRPSVLAAAMIGATAMAAVDEAVFHQILGWHHFYDRATPVGGSATNPRPGRA